MTGPKDVFDTAALAKLLAPHYEQVRAQLLEPGAMEAVATTMGMVYLFKSSLTRLGVTPEEMERAEKASTHAEAAQILRAAISKEQT